MADLHPGSPHIDLLAAEGWKDYELLDSGAGAKLERFGAYVFIRPEHQAVWKPALPSARWEAAHAEFCSESGEETGGRWITRKNVPETWEMRYRELRFMAHFTSSRHLGVFPEQASQWDWIAQNIRQADRPVRVLNLFGYTGLATLAAAQAGAEVTHVDAAKKSVGWARENVVLSGLEQRPVRWILDDALKFVQREARRGSFYDGIVLDPPKFGRGPKGEVWEVFEMLPTLLDACRAILAPKPLFVVITAYAIRASALSLYYSLSEKLVDLGGNLECGELVSVERSARRRLSHAIYARWKGGT
jgi:23S rRNA (cytosine1962-C5)-methyltransferase